MNTTNIIITVVAVIIVISQGGAAPPLNYRLALWTDLAVGANGPPIH